jgi:hypothetical protein
LQAEKQELAALLTTGSKPVERQNIAPMLEHWQRDPDLAGLRDPELLADLPDEEQQRYRQFWEAAASLHSQAEEQQ